MTGNSESAAVAARARDILGTELASRLRARRFLVMRHGETEHNRRRIIQGQLDIPLNENGARHAALVAASLAPLPIAAVHASDLCRAWDTALAVARVKRCSLAPDPGLRERHFGAWQDMPTGGLHWRTEPPEGEVFAAFVHRVAEAAARTAQRDDVMLVTHGGPILVLLGALGLPVPPEGVRNCAPLLLERATEGRSGWSVRAIPTADAACGQPAGEEAPPS